MSGRQARPQAGVRLHRDRSGFLFACAVFVRGAPAHPLATAPLIAPAMACAH